MKYFLTLIITFLTLLDTFAQTGYIGKRNELQFEGFNAMLQGKYGFSYKFCLSNSVLLKADFGFHRKKLKDQFYIKDNYNYSGDRQYYHSDIQFSGNTWGLSLIFGGYNVTNMPLPVGYYWGFGFMKTKGIANQISQVTTYYNYYSSTYGDSTNREIKNYNVNSTILKIIWGRNFALTEFLTLDFSLDFGININKNDVGLVTALPYSNPIWKTRTHDFWDENPSLVYLYLMPNICIGYIF